MWDCRTAHFGGPHVTTAARSDDACGCDMSAHEAMSPEEYEAYKNRLARKRKRSRTTRPAGQEALFP